MTETEQNLVNCTLDNFDFDKVFSVMTHLNWKWRDGVPDLFAIKQYARKLFKDAIERSPATLARYDTACGGFHITIYREDGVVVYVEIKFCIATSKWDVEYLGEV